MTEQNEAVRLLLMLADNAEKAGNDVAVAPIVIRDALATPPPAAQDEPRWDPNEEHCHKCGRHVGVVWTAPDDLWEKVMGGPGGIRCIRCFDEDAGAAGVPLLRWVPQPADIWPAPAAPPALDGLVAELIHVDSLLRTALADLAKTTDTLARLSPDQEEAIGNPHSSGPPHNDEGIPL